MQTRVRVPPPIVINLRVPQTLKRKAPSDFNSQTTAGSVSSARITTSLDEVAAIAVKRSNRPTTKMESLGTCSSRDFTNLEARMVHRSLNIKFRTGRKMTSPLPNNSSIRYNQVKVANLAGKSSRKRKTRLDLQTQLIRPLRQIQLHRLSNSCRITKVNKRAFNQPLLPLCPFQVPPIRLPQTSLLPSSFLPSQTKRTNKPPISKSWRRAFLKEQVSLPPSSSRSESPMAARALRMERVPKETVVRFSRSE